jgi:hypothetical protein
MRVALQNSLHRKHIGGRTSSAEQFPPSTIDETDWGMNIDNIVLIPSVQDPAGNADGKNEGLDALRPYRFRHNVVTKPAVDIVSKVLKFASMI